MKKTLFLTTAFLSAAVSGWGAVSLLEGFTPVGLSSGSTQINWIGDESSYSQGWAVSFDLNIPGTVGKGDPLFSTGSGPVADRGHALSFVYGHVSGASGYTLQFGPNGGGDIFKTEAIDSGLLLSSTLTLIVKQIEDTLTSSVSLYLGETLIGSGTANQLLSLTQGSSTLWTNGGKEQLSNIQGVVFDKTTGDMDVLAALRFIPEPATASMGLLGLTALLMRRRRV